MMFESVSKNLVVLFFLYFVQGLPYGIQTGFLPVYLRSKGVSLTNVGLYKFLFAPWFCKVLWAPFVDRYGTKRKWLIASMVAMVLSCGLGAFITPEHILLLCSTLFILNIFTSIQDIAVDGLAIKILHTDELSQGNIAQVVGYKVGSLFGGGVLTWSMELIGWMGTFLTLSALYVEAVLYMYLSPMLRQLDSIEESVTMNIDEKDESQYHHHHDSTRHNHSHGHGHTHGPSGHSHNTGHSVGQYKSRDQEKEKQGKSKNNNGHLGALQFISSVLNTPGTKWVIGYVLLYKLGEQGACHMLPLFLLDHQVSAADIGLWTGVIGQGVSICGSLLGGWALSRYNVPAVFLLQQLSACRLLPMGAMLWVVTTWVGGVHNVTLTYYGAVVAFSILMFCSGMITTVTFTLMMQCSQDAPEKCQATHFTFLATLEVLGKVVFLSLAGYMVDVLGYPLVFVIFIGLSFLLLPYLNMCPDNLVIFLNVEQDSEYEQEFREEDCAPLENKFEKVD